MELDISTWMMIAFIVALVGSLWKVYAILPNKELEDDDTTADAQEHLTSLMLSTIKEHSANTTVDELYTFMIEKEEFNSEKYWRFNINKLKQLLNAYYIKNPELTTIADIYNNQA
jgi:hypothetical protein